MFSGLLQYQCGLSVRPNGRENSISQKSTQRKRGRCRMKNSAAAPFYNEGACSGEGMWKIYPKACLFGHSKAGVEGKFGAKCGKYSVFPDYAVIFSDARVWRRPCSRFIHSFFKLNAMASRNASARIFTLPLVRNLRKPKSFFSSPKAPST